MQLLGWARRTGATKLITVAFSIGLALSHLPVRLEATWRRGRATYYGGPSTLGSTYDSSRGEGSFGILAFGSCGYTNSDGSLLFARDTYAASADANDDYPGSCGRCYEVKCDEGVVYDDPNTTIRIVDGYFNGDVLRPYLAAINPNFKDSNGRSWPGNPEASRNILYTKCWDKSKVIRVRVADSCPCTQVLSEGAPGVKKGGEVRTQKWCCGGEHHFDISYWGFEQLAHPVYGAMMLKYRAVDCSSGAEIDRSYISQTIFRDVPQPGWAFVPDKAQKSQLSLPGAGPDGSGATCVSVSKQGGLSFRCRECYKPGFQPFKNATALQFWIRSNGYALSSGQLPGLKLFLLNEERKEYCGAEPVLGKDVQPERRQGNWYKITLPFSDFKCGNGLVADDQLDNLSFQNIGEQTVEFCLADVKILGPGGAKAGGTRQGAALVPKLPPSPPPASTPSQPEEEAPAAQPSPSPAKKGRGPAPSRGGSGEPADPATSGPKSLKPAEKPQESPRTSGDESARPPRSKPRAARPPEDSGMSFLDKWFYKIFG